MPVGMVKTDRSTRSRLVEPTEASLSLLSAARPRGLSLRLIFQCLVFFIGLNCVVAQSSPRIAGSVLDSKTMTPVSGAVVLLAGTLHGSLTGPDGRFEFTGINPGKYILTVSAEGYTTFQESVDVEDNLELKILLMLEAYDFTGSTRICKPTGRMGHANV